MHQFQQEVNTVCFLLKAVNKYAVLWSSIYYGDNYLYEAAPLESRIRLEDLNTYNY